VAEQNDYSTIFATKFNIINSPIKLDYGGGFGRISK